MKPKTGSFGLSSLVLLVALGLWSPPTQAGYCSATGELGSSAACQVKPSSAGTCTVRAMFVRFNSACALCLTGPIRCDLEDTTNDFRVDLSTTQQNWTDAQILNPTFVGPTGGQIFLSCFNMSIDSIELSMYATCNQEGLLR
jgi:hypothetical protein